MTTTTTELTGFASIALIYALDSNPEGWVNEESLLDLAIGGGSGKRMINEGDSSIRKFDNIIFNRMNI
jgi:hypothetical protein